MEKKTPPIDQSNEPLKPQKPKKEKLTDTMNSIILTLKKLNLNDSEGFIMKTKILPESEQKPILTNLEFRLKTKLEQESLIRNIRNKITEIYTKPNINTTSIGIGIDDTIFGIIYGMIEKHENIDSIIKKIESLELNSEWLWSIVRSLIEWKKSGEKLEHELKNLPTTIDKPKSVMDQLIIQQKLDAERFNQLPLVEQIQIMVHRTKEPSKSVKERLKKIFGIDVQTNEDILTLIETHKTEEIDLRKIRICL